MFNKITVLAAALFVASVSAQDIGACLGECLAAGNGECDVPTDVECMCTNSVFQETFLGCLNEKCADQLDAALALQATQCGDFTTSASGADPSASAESASQSASQSAASESASESASQSAASQSASESAADESDSAANPDPTEPAPEDSPADEGAALGLAPGMIWAAGAAAVGAILI
ncbi:hypothetical protein BDV98DRAFT_574725 [Pterulicium gracile]|uniref:CFEM domain-containing protein n=1 Tax=Pterulicium gracile TaxID=1884261 RepID=A0A5C3Q5L0_9AGAR|nr:hypothetical protein BDV98DRAFT_574725 [Pterula gracilis]